MFVLLYYSISVSFFCYFAFGAIYLGPCSVLVPVCAMHSIIGWLIYKMHIRQLTTNNINVKRVCVYSSMQLSKCFIETDSKTYTLRPYTLSHKMICTYAHALVSYLLHQCMLRRAEPQDTCAAAFEVAIFTQGQLRGLPSWESGQTAFLSPIPTTPIWLIIR